MKISKKDALEWMEYLSFLSEKKIDVYFKYESLINSIFKQIEISIQDKNDKIKSSIKNLQSLDNRTFFVGDLEKFPKGCHSCLFGKGLGAIRKTNKCNLKCKFCYYYDNLENQKEVIDGIWEIGGTKFYEKDIELLISTYNKPSGVAYVYLEPFLEIEKYYSVIEKFNNAKIYQHLYTNGTLTSEEQLRKLGEIGLDEIRFNLGATNCSDQVIENIRIAKKYIKNVGIETPMTPEFFNLFLEKKELILNTGVDFINCAELHLNSNNIKNYESENLYMSRFGYISPIWSRELTLKFMKIASDEKWNTLIHDCSNHTKFSRELNSNNKLNMWFGATSYGLEFSEIPYKYFLKILKDENFNFLEEEDLPEKYKLKNIKGDN